MKKIFALQYIVSTVMLLFIITVANAQTTQDSLKTQEPKTTTTTPPPPPPPAETKNEGFNSHTRFGIRGGGIISKQDYENNGVTENPKSKVGGDLAILAAFPIGGGFFAIQPELHWMQKGYKIEDAIDSVNITSTLDYIELPVLFRLNFGGSIRLFAFGGPCVGYLLSGTYENNGVSKDPTEYLDELEFSAHVGAGVGLGTFEIDLRYMAGLNDISDSPDLTNVKNSSFGAGITLKF